MHIISGNVWSTCDDVSTDTKVIVSCRKTTSVWCGGDIIGRWRGRGSRGSRERESIVMRMIHEVITHDCVDPISDETIIDSIVLMSELECGEVGRRKVKGVLEGKWNGMGRKGER